MINVIDVIRYNIFTCSELIWHVKVEDARKPRRVPNLKMLRFEEVLFKHICPQHPNWKTYQALKRECSLWLVALHLEKKALTSGELLDKGVLSHLSSNEDEQYRAVRKAGKMRMDVAHSLNPGVIVGERFDKETREYTPIHKRKEYSEVAEFLADKERARTQALSKRKEVEVHG